jgi:hypothetical protein
MCRRTPALAEPHHHARPERGRSSALAGHVVSANSYIVAANVATGDRKDVGAPRPLPPHVDEIARFRSATSVMRTVYEVAMVLGLKQMISAAYTAFSPTLRPKHAVLAWYSDVGLFVIVLLIAIRFFWVTRNISSYLRAHAREMVESDEERIKVAREIILVHFPTIILHALVFYFLSNSAAEAMGATYVHGHGLVRAYDFVAEFVTAAGVLLALTGYGSCSPSTGIRARSGPATTSSLQSSLGRSAGSGSAACWGRAALP